MIQSSLFQEGRAEGRLEGQREMCIVMVRQYHPAVFERVRPRIESCQDAGRLREWVLQAPNLSDADYVRLLES